MKLKTYGLLTSILLGCALLPSCANDDLMPDGQGELRMKMVVNSTLTRAGEELSEQSLADKCVIYISGTKGLLHKYNGVDNLPASLYLKSGSYVAEAWTGDSVSASFDKKFFRGYQPFEINTGTSTNVVLNCKIANVVASVATSENFANAVTDYKVSVGHSRASLDFTAENQGEHGYFMMPYDNDSAAFESNLTYTVTGTMENGETFTREGTIWNVQRAHEYVINLNYSPTEIDPFGGALITVTIDDHELVIEDRVEISGAPVISGVGYDINSPLLTEPGTFERRSIFVQSLGEYRSLALHTDSYEALGLPSANIDFADASDASKAQFATAGISCQTGVDPDGTHTARIFLEKEMLNRLPLGIYTLQLTAIDANAKKRVATLTLNVSSAGVIIVESDWSDIYAHRATVYAKIVKEDVINPGIRYRETGTDTWTTVYPSNSNRGLRRAAGDVISLQLTGLKSGTRYEYQALCEGFTNENSMFFTTESEFVLPNASFEQWSMASDNKTVVPSADGTVSFWDSGNHGSSKMNKNVTTQATNLFNSGTSSAKLQSQFVGIGAIGKFAAGNLFTGTFDGTEQTTQGILTFGRAHNGSRPVKLRGYVYYHPGTVDYSEKDNKHPDVVKGSTDKGIIYVALTNRTFKIRTATEELFDANSSDVLAYGQMLFTGDYGTSSAMREFEITLEYKDASKLQRAGYIIICASASQYGDYFTGSTSSVMYVDDLELVY